MSVAWSLTLVSGLRLVKIQNSRPSTIIMSEVLNREIDGQELAVEGIVMRFGRFEFLGEVRDGVPLTANPLLEYSPHSYVRGISHHSELSINLQSLEDGSKALLVFFWT